MAVPRGFARHIPACTSSRARKTAASRAASTSCCSAVRRSTCWFSTRMPGRPGRAPGRKERRHPPPGAAVQQQDPLPAAAWLAAGGRRPGRRAGAHQRRALAGVRRPSRLARRPYPLPRLRRARLRPPTGPMLKPEPLREPDTTNAAPLPATAEAARPSGNLALSIGSGYLVQILAQATTLITRVALARIIAPTQWGVFGVAVVIVGFVDALRELNLTQLAKSGRTHRHWRDLPGALTSTTVVALVSLLPI